VGYKNGIANGYDGKFSPNAGITREQMAVMLCNYAVYAGLVISGAEDTEIEVFSDYESISDWAVTSVKWAMTMDILSGNDDGTFAPAANATRAQAAKMTAVLLRKMVG
jgi:hypothetical protein